MNAMGPMGDVAAIGVTVDAAALDRMAGAVLDVLWRSSWQAAVLAGMVFALQLALGRRLSARWRHNLWLLVLLRLVVPVTPQSSWSVFNLSPRDDASSRVASVDSIDAIPIATPLAVSHDPAAADAATPPATAAKPIAFSATRPLPWRLIVASVWLAGALVLLARIAVATLRLTRSARRMGVVIDDAILRVVGRCRKELQITRSVQVLVSPDLAAPALMGVIRPKVLLPQRVVDAFDPAELRMILLHELAHLKRRDVAVNWLVAIASALHWFNPVLWAAFARLRGDRELACDEMVLTAARADHAQYGQTIVKLLESLPRHASGAAGTTAVAPSQAAAVGILERAHPMRRRITMIAQFPRRAKQWTIPAAVAMLALAGFGLTDAVRGDDGKPAPVNPAPARSADFAAKASDPTTVANAPRPTAGEPFAGPIDLEGNAQVTATKADPFAAGGFTAVATTKAATTHPDSTVTTLTADRLTFTSGARTGELSDAEKVYQTFQKRLPEVRFDKIALSDAVDFLRDVTDQNFAVNWGALEAAGVDRNAPIDVRLKNATLEEVLRQLGKAAGGSAVAMGFAVEGGTIVLSTEEDTVRITRVRAYDVSDLLTSATTRPGPEGTAVAMEELKQVITGNVTPDSWREAGGTVSNANAFGSKLLVNAPDMTHLQVDRLLAELRRN